MNNREMMRIRQAIKQAGYPSDRIAFCEEAVTADQAAMKQWADMPNVSLTWLRKQIAFNNYLDEFFPHGLIPTEMMKNELKLIGWKKKRMEESEEWAD